MGAHANWEAQMDLVSAGAAASVVLHQACTGSSDQALQNAAKLILEYAEKLPEPQRAYDYASVAYESKIKALWQSTGGSCNAMARLRDIAKTTRFTVP